MALPVALGLASAGIGALQAVGGLIGARGQQKKATEAIEAIGTYTASPESAAFLQEAKQRIGTGLGAVATDIAKQGIGASAAQATRAALMSGRGSGLGLIGAIQKQQARSFQDLARQSAQAENINLARLGQATQMFNVERARQFQSEQEKQQLKANIELEKVAAKRAMLSQGLSGLMSGLSTAAMVAPGKAGGEQTNLSKLADFTTSARNAMQLAQMTTPIAKPQVALPKVPNKTNYSVFGASSPEISPAEGLWSLGAFRRG